MSIRKCGSGWVVRRHVWKRLPNRREAELYDTLLTSALAEVDRQYDSQARPCCRIRDKLDEFLGDSQIGMRRRPCNAHTAALHKKRLLAFDAAFHSRPLDAITREDIEGWIRRRMKTIGRNGRIEAGTVNADLVSLRAFARWAQGKGHASAALPLLTVGKLRTKGNIAGTNRKPPKALEMAEVLDIIDQIRTVRTDVALVLTGMVLWCLRPHALCRLERIDAKLPRPDHPGSLHCVGLKGYHDRLLPVFMGSQQHAWLRECIELGTQLHGRAPRPDDPLIPSMTGRCKRNPGGWTTATLDAAVARICGQSGLRFRPYQIRHSVVSWLQQSPGMSSATVQATAAHSSVSTQDIYGRRHGLEAVPAFKALADLVANYGSPQENQGVQVGGVSSR